MLRPLRVEPAQVGPMDRSTLAGVVLAAAAIQPIALGCRQRWLGRLRAAEVGRARERRWRRADLVDREMVYRLADEGMSAHGSQCGMLVYSVRSDVGHQSSWWASLP